MPTPAQIVVLPQQKAPLEIVDMALPDPGPHQVVVAQAASGICHTQLHQIHGDRESAFVLGHESTGTVAAAGSEVRHVAEGDSVMVTWVRRDAAAATRLPDRACLTLPDGRTADCRNVFTWASHTIADEQYVVKMDASIDKDVTAIIGCAIMTGAGAVENTADVQKGDSVAVFGVGGVGLAAVVAARERGAHPLIAVDLDDDKLDFARAFGASHTINARDEDPIEAIRALTTRERGHGHDQSPVRGADFVFDCIGVKATMEQIVPAARSGFFGAEPGGTAVLVGVPVEELQLNAGDLLVNEKRLIGSIGGSCQPDRHFARYLDWYVNGKLDLKALVTRRYRLDEINDAVAALEKGEIQGRAILEF